MLWVVLEKQPRQHQGDEDSRRRVHVPLSEDNSAHSHLYRVTKQLIPYLRAIMVAVPSGSFTASKWCVRCRSRGAMSKCSLGCKPGGVRLRFFSARCLLQFQGRGGTNGELARHGRSHHGRGFSSGWNAQQGGNHVAAALKELF